MVTMRSFSEMKLESVLSSVVLPEPVPPEMTMFSLAFTQPLRNSSMGGVNAWNPQQISGTQRRRAEAPDGENRPIDRQRRNDAVDTGAVRQTRIHHRRGLVDASPDRGDDFVDDVQKMLVVLEGEGGLLQLRRAVQRR